MANYNFYSIDSHISRLMDHFDHIEKESLKAIEELRNGEEEIDFRLDENEEFYDNCDRAVVGIYDRHAECEFMMDVVSIQEDGVLATDEFSSFKNWEDMTVAEVFGVYRMIAQFREWQEKGEITIA